MRHSGFVTSSEAGLARGTLTMRVPASKLDAALADVRELGKVVQMTTTAEDISAQIVDVRARLRTLEAEELQLLELLRRASGVSQILEVRDRLNAVRQEIESLEAQRELYESQVEYATIVATIHEKGAPEPGDGDDPIIVQAWRTALRAGLTILSGLLVVLGGLVPLAAVGAAVWFALRVVRRRRA
jgi:predicted nuclease with TOPRIM domain